MEYLSPQLPGTNTSMCPEAPVKQRPSLAVEHPLSIEEERQWAEQTREHNKRVQRSLEFDFDSRASTPEREIETPGGSA